MQILPEPPKAHNSQKTKQERIQGATRLSEASPEDAPWSMHGSNAQTLMVWFSVGDEWQQKKAEKMEYCGRELIFAVKKNGEHKLKKAEFCRIRFCPRCVWRRSLAWKARWYGAWPELMKEVPKARFFHLVLSTPNVPVEDLKKELSLMNTAWKRMISRNTWPAIGFVRSTEVTIEKTRKGYVNPHFHCLVMVRNSYFKEWNYMTADTWRTYWASALGRHPEEMNKPFIRAIDPKLGVDGVAAAVREVFKYAVKGIEMKKNDRGDWVQTLLEMDRQLKGTQATALGGLIRQAFKGREEVTEEEMLAVKDESDSEAEKYLRYLYHFILREYRLGGELAKDDIEALEETNNRREKKKAERKGALSKPLPAELQASPEVKEDWDLNKVGLKLGEQDQKKQNRIRKLEGL
jgi:plasmid rolling circle replication initiator protein Rep